MRKLIILSCVLLGVNCYSQTAEEIKYIEQAEASINDDIYASFLKEVIKFRTSEQSLKEIYFKNSYIEKIGSIENSKNTCSLSEQDFEKWVTKNLDKTKFSSIKEAVEIRNNYQKYTKLNESKNIEISLKLDEYKVKYGLLIDREFNSSLAKAENNALKKLYPSG